MTAIYRAFICQPSTLQPLHKLNGVYCIAVDNGGTTIQLFFTEGSIHSIEAPRNSISKINLSAKGERNEINNPSNN